MALSSTIGLMVHPDHVGGEELGSEPFGTGPYTLDLGASDRQRHLHVPRRDDYWAAEAYPYSTVVVKVISDLAGDAQRAAHG